MAPASTAYNGVNEYYPTEREYVYAIADALKQEYQTAYQSGLIVQVDDAVLAVLRLTLHDQQRAWKGFDWDTLDRLHRKGLIANPVNKAKSVVLTDEGLRRSEALVAALFGKARDA